MKIALADAAARLRDLVARAESGEEVILTEDGREVARLVRPTPPAPAAAPGDDAEPFEAFVADIQRRVRAKLGPGVTARDLEEALYDDETGLPR